MAVFYTIGHSNITVDEFVGRLSAHGVALVVDVRSDPYSKYASQFNKREIEVELKNRGFDYLYLGEQLGGKPRSPGFLTPAGVPDYEKMAETDRFKSGIAQIEEVAKELPLALMCSEGDPMVCHRERLLGWVLRNRGHEMRHIGSDGSITREEQRLLL